MSYLAQYNRVLRWREQLNNTELNHDLFEDYIIAYFQNCYHLKEWIINDSTVPEITKSDPKAIKKQLEEYISNTHSLLICADIAKKWNNPTVPSLFLKTYTSGRLTYEVVEGDATIESYTTSPYKIEHKYVVKGLKDAHSINMNALSLADNCIEAWQNYFKITGLQY